MNFMEMFVVVLAVMLFSTAAVIQHRTMLAANDRVIDAGHTVQSLQLAHEVLDEIDARLFIPKSDAGIAFNKIFDQYDSTQRYYDLDYYGEVFNLEITAVPCDNFGRTNVAANTKLNLLVTVLVHGPAGQTHDVTLRRIYTPYSVEGL